MGRRDRKIVLICQCLANPFCTVHTPGQDFPLSLELMNYLLKRNVGVIQYMDGNGADEKPAGAPAV